MKKTSFLINCLLLAVIIGSAVFHPVGGVSAANAVSGKVWQEVDMDGVQSSDTWEPGQSGVTVKLFGSSGALLSTATTGTDGTYSFFDLSDPGPYRIEFSGFAASLQAAPSSKYPNNLPVQFVAAGSSATINLMLIDPTKCNPYIASSCFVGKSSPNDAAILLVPLSEISNLGQPYVYNNFDLAWTDGQFHMQTPMKESPVATQSEVGPVDGLAYSSDRNMLFSAAFAKNVAGNVALMGPQGPGGVYATDIAAKTTIPYAVVQDAGSISSWDKKWVGKVGLGDIDISPDNKTLYTINLSAKTLVIIDATLASGLPVSVPNSSPGQLALGTLAEADCGTNPVYPFAVKAYDGGVYIGMVCKDKDQAYMKGLVYSYSTSGSTFTQVLNFNFNYTRADLNANLWGRDVNAYLRNNESFVDWETYNADAEYLARTQPWIVDLEIDNGDLIIGVRSRLSDIISNSNWVLGGELLRACKSGTSFVLESNGVCGGHSTIPAAWGSISPEAAAYFNGPAVPTAGQLAGHAYDPFIPWRWNIQYTSKGPGGYEYYWGDDGYEGEAVQGSLAQVEGAPYVITTQLDGIGHFGQQGLWKVDNQLGYVTGAGNIFTYNPDINKANGLGDIEVVCPSWPLQIGNRVWEDTNANGVQDPGEAALAGVTVELWDASGTTLIESAVTDKEGYFLFSSSKYEKYTDTNSHKAGLSLIMNTNYQLRIKMAQAALTGRTTTLVSTGSGINDNQAEMDGTYAVISLTTETLFTNKNFGFTKGSALDSSVGSTLHGNPGFPPDRTTLLPAQPAGSRYDDSITVSLEIPSQGQSAAILGVPLTGGGWDVSWLGQDVGWLQGSVFPTWVGNSVLVAHVVDADGKPGPFHGLKELKYGDQVVVHLTGGSYVYEVRETTLLETRSLEKVMERLDKFSYLTLLTCEDYDPASGTYLYRRMVRLVLTEVAW